MEELKIIYLPPGELTPYDKNTKEHPEAQVKHIANSIREFGFKQPIVIDSNNVVVIGHGRLLAAKKLGLDEVPCLRADDLTEAQIKALRLADNKTNESEWDFLNLEAELAELELDFDMSDFGFDTSEIEPLGTSDDNTGSLAQKYLVPPFSVIYGNKPDWIKRKRKWVNFGIRSELGRGGTCLQYKEQSRGKLPTKIGGGERSKAFKNNTRLNSYMTGRKPLRRAQ